MPYLEDGTFVADMPAPNVLAKAPPQEGGETFVPFDRRTGTPYRQFVPKSNSLAKVPKSPAAPKPGYAHLDVPEFPDYVKFAASRDGIDLSTADDKQLLGYAKEYSENMLPQALMAAGHKVDKEYLKTLTPNFQYKAAQALPQLREYFKANAAPSATPNSASDGVIATTGNVLKEIPAGLAEGIGNQLGAAAHSLEGDVNAPNFKFDTDAVLALMNPAFALRKAATFVKNSLAKQEPGYNESLDKVGSLLANSGRSVAEAIKESQTPAYKEDQKQPFLSGEPFVKNGKINPGYFNAKALNIAKLIGAPAEGVGEIAPALAATYATRSPVPIIASMGLSGAGRAWQEEENRLKALPEDQLSQLPAYQALLKDGYSPEGAKQALVFNSSAVQGQIGGTAGALMGVLAELPWLQKSAGGFLNKVAKNILKQGTGFGALAGAQQATSNVLRNKETGGNTPTSQGVGEAVIGGAAGALPFAVAGGFAKPKEQAANPLARQPETPPAAAPEATPAVPQANAAAAPETVQSSIAQAFQENPIPPKEALADPIAAKAHYDEALATFRGDMQGADVPAADIVAAQPAFDAAWKEATGLDPAALSKPVEAAAPPEAPLPASTPAELDAAAAAAPPELPAFPKADPDIVQKRADAYRRTADALLNESPGDPAVLEKALALHEKADALDAQAQDIREQQKAATRVKRPAAPVDNLPPVPARSAVDELGLNEPPAPGAAVEAREATAADHLSEGLRNRITEDLAKRSGREPTPAEIATAAGHLFDIALSDPRIDSKIPRVALEEAVSQLAEKSAELPSAKEINALAKKLQTERVEVSAEQAPLQNVLEDKFNNKYQDFLDKTAKRQLMESRGREILDTMSENGETPQSVSEKFWSSTYDKLPFNVQKRFEAMLKEHTGMEAGSGTTWKDIAKEVDLGSDASYLEGTDRGFTALMKEAIDRFDSENPRNPLAKKDEAASKEQGSLANERTEVLKEGEQLATPEEAAKLKPAEDYFRKFDNAGDAARDLASRVTAPYLQRALQLLLRNEHGVRTLDETKLAVRNPDELAKSPSGETIGHSLTKESEKMFRRNTRTGVYDPRDGITLAGSKWKALNAIDTGVHPVTFIHEALHAKLAGTLRAIENGDISQGSMIAAYRELEGIRQSLSANIKELPIAKEAEGALKYALSEGKGPHEFLSVTLSDPRVQAALRDVTVGKVNLWQKILGIFNRLLGGTPEDLPILDRIFSLAEHIGDYDINAKKEGESLYSKSSERIENRDVNEVIKATDIKEPKAPTREEMHSTPNVETRTEKATTNFLNSLAPLRRLNEFLARKNIKVDPKANIFDEATRYQSTSQRAAALAKAQYINPMLDFFVSQGEKLGMQPVEFANQLKNWYLGKHALERNEFFELKKGRLTKEAEVARAAVLDQWNAGKLPDGQLLAKLREIVNAPGARVENRSPLYASGYSTEQAHAMISKARRAGITPEVIAKFEPLKKNAENAAIENGLKSRRFSAADEARRSGIGFKYYLPLKGFADARELSTGSGPGAFASEYTAAQGRESLSQNPLLSLMQSVVRSAKDTAENEFTKSIYNFAKQHGKEFGITVRTYPIEKMIQEGGLEDLTRIYKDENTVVHNNGEYRYAITFPEGAPAIKAIKEVTAPAELGDVAKWFGKVSNFIGRGATTFSPRFLLWNNIWRDFLYNPTLMASDLGAKATARYVKEYFGQGGPFGAVKYYFKGKHPRNILEREQFAEGSTSPFAKDMQLIAKYGGDLSFEHQLNDATKSVENLFNHLDDATKKTAGAKEKLLAAQHFMDSIATVGMMSTRRAAFRAYVDEAMSGIKNPTEEQKTQVYKDGALYSRRLLDYQQKSELGRTLNAYWIFSRVALTHADRIAALFRNEDGSYNYKKMATTAGLMMTAGAAYYTMLKQADPEGVKKMDNGTFATMFPIPAGDGTYLNIPAPYGPWRLGFVPGIMAARAFEGDTSVIDAANVIRNAYAENLSPLRLPEASHNEGFSDQMFDFLQAATPTAARPLADIALNKNAFGDRITPSYNVTGPHHEVSKSSTPETIKAVADGLAKMGIDVYPESLQYLLAQYGTGPVADLLRGVKQAENAVQGKEVQGSKLPFVPNVINRDADYYEMRKISELREDLEYRSKQPDFTEQDKELLKRIRSSQTRYSKQVKAVEKNTLMSPAAKEKQIKDIRNKQKAEQATLITEAERE